MIGNTNSLIQPLLSTNVFIESNELSVGADEKELDPKAADDAAQKSKFCEGCADCAQLIWKGKKKNAWKCLF